MSKRMRRALLILIIGLYLRSGVAFAEHPEYAGAISLFCLLGGGILLAWRD